jgi:hypothetical protein
MGRPGGLATGRDCSLDPLGQLSRRGVRMGMGLPPDKTDQLVPAEEEIQELLHRPFPSSEEAMETMRAHRAPTEVRTLLWPRSEFDAAREHLAGAMDQEVSQAQYYRDLENKLLAMATEGARRVSAVSCSVDSLALYVDRAGDRPLDSSAARREYLDAHYSEGHYLEWPPPRNQPAGADRERSTRSAAERRPDNERVMPKAAAAIGLSPPAARRIAVAKSNQLASAPSVCCRRNLGAAWRVALLGAIDGLVRFERNVRRKQYSPMAPSETQAGCACLAQRFSIDQSRDCDLIERKTTNRPAPVE